MFDPIQNQSIQRWEYEGGRILPGRNGTIPSRDQNSPRLSQNVIRGKSNSTQTINNFSIYETETVSRR